MFLKLGIGKLTEFITVVRDASDYRKGDRIEEGRVSDGCALHLYTEGGIVLYNFRPQQGIADKIIAADYPAGVNLGFTKQVTIAPSHSPLN